MAAGFMVAQVSMLLFNVLGSGSHRHEISGLDQSRELGHEGNVLASIPLGSTELAEVLDEVLHVLDGGYIAGRLVSLLELVHKALHGHAQVAKVGIHLGAEKVILACSKDHLLKILLHLCLLPKQRLNQFCRVS